MVPGLKLVVDRLRFMARLPGFLRRPRAIKQPLTLTIQITEVFGLQAVGQNAIQKMTGQVRGWPPPQDAVPTSPKLADVEIAQARNLDISSLPVRDRRADLDARHGVQDVTALVRASPSLAAACTCDPVDPVAVHFLRAEFQLETLAHHAGKEAAHRVLLPARGLHHRGDRCASW